LNDRYRGDGSDVVLETMVLVSRRLEDKKMKVLVLDHEVLVLGLEHLVLVSILKKKSGSFSRLLL